MTEHEAKGSIEELVEAYQTARSAYMAEQYLDELVARSTLDNYLAIIHQMKQHAKFHELDLSLYINDIAKPEFSGLMEVITELRKTFKDKDALEDLEEAAAKIRQP